MQDQPESNRRAWLPRALGAVAATAAGGGLAACWLRGAIPGRTLEWGPNEYPAAVGINPAWGGVPWAFALAALAAVVMAALWKEGRAGSVGRARPASLLWYAASGLMVVILARVLAEMGPRIRYPLDLLLWSESSFLQDMIKFHKGLSPYLPASSQNSFVYNPGAPLLTWAVSSLCGRYGDLAFARSLQVVCALLACGAAWLAARQLARGTQQTTEGDRPAPVVAWALGLFVVAAGLNPVTSPHVDLLHTDALALLLSAVCLLALTLRPRVSPTRWLWLAAPLPALAFLTKQTGSVIWLGMALGVWVQDRRFKSAAVFGAASAALIAAEAGVLSVWSDGWWSYWTISVLSKQMIVLKAGVEYNLWVVPVLLLPAAAALGWLAWGARRMGGPGRVFLSAALYSGLLAASATVTTSKCGTYGANHWGSAALGICILGAAAVALFLRQTQGGRSALRVERATVALLVLAVLLLHRASRPVPGPDENQYAARCQQFLARLDLGRTLLDHGSIQYLQRDLLPLDRANSVLETASGGVCKIDGTVDRIMAQSYDRILIHKFFGESWYTGDVAKAVQVAYELKDQVPGLYHKKFNGFMMTDVLVYEPRPADEVQRLPTYVLSTEPPGGTINGRVPKEVRVRFNHLMKSETINPETTFLMTKNAKGVVTKLALPASSVRYEPDSMTAVITPPAPLKGGRYWIMVTDGVRDVLDKPVWTGAYHVSFQIKRVFRDYKR